MPVKRQAVESFTLKGFTFRNIWSKWTLDLFAKKPTGLAMTYEINSEIGKIGTV